MRQKAAFAWILSFSLAACQISFSHAVATDSECSWRVHVGLTDIAPSDAPYGMRKYIFRLRGTGGLRKVSAALTELASSGTAAGDGEELVDSIREMRALKNMMSVRMSRKAMKWLCGQQYLDEYIIDAEIDQPVSIFSRDGRLGRN